MHFTKQAIGYLATTALVSWSFIHQAVAQSVPAIAQTPAGWNCEPLTDKYQVRWIINGDDITFELVGEIADDGYMAFGISGSSDSTFMIGADTIIAVS